jgi:APA family basic amino acid/polyamine antiporter
LGTGDAVVLGLGSMIGASVFAAFGPAATGVGSPVDRAGGRGVIAYRNAVASAQLAASYPASGGTYCSAASGSGAGGGLSPGGAS